MRIRYAKAYADVSVRSSDIDGRGLFANSNIKAGTIVTELTGRAVRGKDVDWHSCDKGILQIDDDLYLEETGKPDDYINHSCEPNLAFNEEGTAFYALRDIQKEEELFFDYSTCENDPEWKVPCLCGTPSCRKFLTGFSRLDARTKKRLLPYCLPYIKNKSGL